MHIRRRFIASLLAVAAATAPLTFADAAQAYPGDTVQLTGHGFGHGRGLSQYGSLGYALAGLSHTDIVNRYYSNTTAGTFNPSQGIGVRLVEGDAKDLIVVATSNYSVGPVAIPANHAARIRKIGTNTFAIDRALDCAGGGGWAEQATGIVGPVNAEPPTHASGNNLALMIQRCGVDTRGYRGSLSAIDDAGVQRVINNVVIEDYLRGVVPRESPAAWGNLGGGLGMNALRAQAIAARSYALSSPAPRWTTCDTISCQVYGGAFLNGVNIEPAQTNEAIASTAGQVRYLNGAIARTEFSSSSGGWTAGGTFPAVEDAGDSTSQNPNHTWTANIAVSAVQAAYPSVGALNSINVNSRNGLGDQGGRVLSMTISGASGSVTVSGADFRARLGLKSDWFAISNSPSGGIDGYWMVGPDGGVFSFGAAPFHGSTGAIRLARPVVGLTARGDSQGYWMVASDGGVFSFNAPFHGSAGNIRLNQPVVAMASKPDSSGYWIAARDGGIFSYGSAAFHGSTGNIRLNQPIVGMAATPTGNGYWLVAADGGVFAFGDAKFFGSTGDIRLNQPIASIAATPSGNGYWIVAVDGGIFAFGDAKYAGSLPGSKIGGEQVTGISATRTGNGYLVSTLSGKAYSFGDAPQFGGVPSAVPGFRGQVLGIASRYQY